MIRIRHLNSDSTKLSASRGSMSLWIEHTTKTEVDSNNNTCVNKTRTLIPQTLTQKLKLTGNNTCIAKTSTLGFYTPDPTQVDWQHKLA